MTKFCSKCGNQLEISKKFCRKCGTSNPYYINTGNNPSMSSINDYNETLERLRLRKERIEREIIEKERLQDELIRKEKLQLELKELERQKAERLQKAKIIQERFEREDFEGILKKEIEQVKQENEDYKKETANLLNKLHDELQQIEEENRQLKQNFEQLSKAYLDERLKEEQRRVAEQRALLLREETERNARLQEAQSKKLEEKPVLEVLPVQPQTVEEAPTVEQAEEPALQTIPKKHKSPWLLPVAVVLLLGVAAGSIFVYAMLNGKKTTGNPAQVSIDIPKTETQNSAATTAPPVDNSATTPEPNHQVVAPKAAANQASLVPVMPAEHRTKTTSAVFELTEAKAKRDLVGKKLSGCDITVTKASEITGIAGLTLVEKLPTGDLKFKANVKVIQGGETYNSVPYFYYSPDGRFIKLDATTCE